MGLSSFYDLQDCNHIMPHCLRNAMYFQNTVHILSSSRFDHTEAQFINHLQHKSKQLHEMIHDIGCVIESMEHEHGTFSCGLVERSNSVL